MSCPVCYTDYSTIGAHIPLVFPCAHGICEMCFNGLPVNTLNEKKCVLCNYSCSPNSVHRNYSLIESLDKFENEHAVTGTQVSILLCLMYMLYFMF